jgi:hypothetical protein
MSLENVCRHGLLTLERNGVRIHAHDGSLCAAASPVETMPPEPEPEPEPVAVADEPAAAAPVPDPPVPATPAEPDAGPLAYETVLASAPVTHEPAVVPRRPGRRSASWLLIAAVCAAVLLVGAGVAGGLVARNAVDQEKDRTSAAERHAASLEDRLANRDATIADQQGRITDFEQQQSSIEQREAELDRREKELARPTGPNAATFGDGIYQSRVAIQPGEYRTEGTDACYWAKLSTGDTNAIIENNLVAGPQTVTVDSPYFESENCGTWTKVTSQ